MQWQEKSHVTDVTRFEKWHQWHLKNKHIARGDVDTQWVIILVQSVQWVFTLKYFLRLSLQQEILIVEEALEILEETFLKVEEELGDTRRRIFISWRRIVIQRSEATKNLSAFTKNKFLLSYCHSERSEESRKHNALCVQILHFVQDDKPVSTKKKSLPSRVSSSSS